MSENSENKCELRTGYVSDYDAKRHMARVIFPDKGDLVSGWLPISVRNSLKNHDEHHLDINEHVACLFTGNGIEEGLVLSALYDDKNPPPFRDKDSRRIEFEDGTTIRYDRNNKNLEIHCEGTINIKAKGDINIDGANINLNCGSAS